VDTPSLADGLVLVGTFDERLVAIDQQTGEQVWASPAAGRIWGNPQPVDGIAVVGDTAGSVSAVDLRDGTSVWQVEAGAAVVPSPVTREGTVYIVTQAGRILAYSIKDSRSVWTQPREGVRLLSEPVVAGGLLLVAPMDSDTLLVAYDAAGGALRWEFTPTG
jgi:outer membrane protein assembly factor BamB